MSFIGKEGFRLSEHSPRFSQAALHTGNLATNRSFDERGHEGLLLINRRNPLVVPTPNP